MLIFGGRLNQRCGVMQSTGTYGSSGTAGSGVEANHLLEEVGESDGENAGPAPRVEKPPGPIQGKFLGENCLELRRVGRSTLPVVGNGALIDRGVVRHHHRMPAREPQLAVTSRSVLRISGCHLIEPASGEQSFGRSRRSSPRNRRVGCSGKRS